MKIILSKKSIDSGYKFGCLDHSLIIEDRTNNDKKYIVNIPIIQKGHRKSIIRCLKTENQSFIPETIEGINIDLPNYKSLFESHKDLKGNNQLIKAILDTACLSEEQIESLYPHLDPYLGGFDLDGWECGAFGQIGKGWSEYLEQQGEAPEIDDLILFFGRFKEYIWTGTALITKEDSKIKYYIYGYMKVEKILKLSPLITDNNLKWQFDSDIDLENIQWLKDKHPHFSQNAYFNNYGNILENNHILTSTNYGIFKFNTDLFLTNGGTQNLNPCVVKNRSNIQASRGRVFTNKALTQDETGLYTIKYNGYKIFNSNLEYFNFCFNNGYGKEYILKEEFKDLFEHFKDFELDE